MDIHSINNSNTSITVITTNSNNNKTEEYLIDVLCTYIYIYMYIYKVVTRLKSTLWRSVTLTVLAQCLLYRASYFLLNFPLYINIYTYNIIKYIYTY